MAAITSQPLTIIDPTIASTTYGVILNSSVRVSGKKEENLTHEKIRAILGAYSNLCIKANQLPLRQKKAEEYKTDIEIERFNKVSEEHKRMSEIFTKTMEETGLQISALV